MNIRIMKFGGTSVANAINIEKVINIIFQSKTKGENIFVVVSAFGGVTDDLIKLANLASQGDLNYEISLKNIYNRHRKTAEELIGSKNRENVLKEIDKKFKELEEIVKKIFLTQKLPSSSLDVVMSFGEQLSSYIMSEAIKNKGVLCDLIDSKDIIKTDDNFGNANVDIETSYKLISEHLGKLNNLAVLGGFIASTKNGVTTTLGRGGSDYSASLLGASLNAKAIEIWTDVDGIMTRDPRKTKDALLIPEISYEKAEEMARNGAKVIHPKTIKPAVLKNIPIYIKNTFNPEGSGTLITNNHKLRNINFSSVRIF